MFVFHTLVGEQIYRKVHQATLAIADAHHRSKRPAHMNNCTPHPVTPTSPTPSMTGILDTGLQENNDSHPHSDMRSTSPEPCTPSLLTPSYVHHHRSRPDVFTFPDIETSSAPTFRIAKEEEISIESGHYAHTSSHYSPTAQSSTAITLLADIDDSQAVTV